MNMVGGRYGNHIAHPVECLFELNSCNRLKAFLDSLLSKTQPPEYAIGDSEPTEYLLFVVSAEFPF